LEKSYLQACLVALRIVDRTGTAASCVDLHPTGFAWSWAWGVSGNQQVGWGNRTTGGQHALLWSGTAASCIDLNPTGFTTCYAYDLSGGQQVGWGEGTTTGNSMHAILWSGTAASYVDLNPSGFEFSAARDVSGGRQVGYGGGIATGNMNHALLWSGSADSYIDIHTFLPTGYSESYAYGIDSIGNIVGYAIWDETGQQHAVSWVLIPAPEAVLLGSFGVGLVGWLRRYRMV